MASEHLSLRTAASPYEPVISKTTLAVVGVWPSRDCPRSAVFPLSSCRRPTNSQTPSRYTLGVVFFG